MLLVFLVPLVFRGCTAETPDRVDYDRMARVTEGLRAVVRTLAKE